MWPAFAGVFVRQHLTVFCPPAFAGVFTVQYDGVVASICWYFCPPAFDGVFVGQHLLVFLLASMLVYLKKKFRPTFSVLFFTRFYRRTNYCPRKERQRLRRQL